MHEVVNMEAFFQEFEKGIDIENPEKSSIPFEIIGYGEISVVIVIKGFENFVVKRLPIFRNEEEAQYYKKIFDRYANILSEEVGLKLPNQFGIPVGNVFYSVQERLPKEWLAQNVFNSIQSETECRKFIDLVLGEIGKICDFNKKGGTISVGLDAQLSNWALKGGVQALSEPQPELIYLDTSTPLFRENGVEMIPADNFLMSVPPILRTIVKMLFMKEVLERYYDCKSILIDFASNLLNEPNGKNVKTALKYIPVNLDEVISYHKRDYIIWKTFLVLRKIHRFILKNIMRRKYRFLIPQTTSVKKLKKDYIKFLKSP